MKTTEKFIIQREDGQFYWKDKSTSSVYGYTEDFNKAYLFETVSGAKKRLYTSQQMKSVIKPVTVILED